MTKEIIIIALILALIYLYYQQKKTNFISANTVDFNEKWKGIEKDIKTKLQQSYQSQLTNYQNQVNRLQNQLKTYQQGKGGEIITNLEEENQQLTEALTKTANEVNELTTTKDELTRDNKTLEQETLSLNNRLRNKSEETNNKDKEIQRLKKEKSQSEISLNKTITELRSDLKDYKKEWQELKTKYSNRESLLDGEQLECKRLTDENEQLQEKIKELERSKSPLPGSWDYEEELQKELKEKEEAFASELSQKDKKIEELTLKITQLETQVKNQSDQLGNTSETPSQKLFSKKEQRRIKK